MQLNIILYESYFREISFLKIELLSIKIKNMIVKFYENKVHPWT